MTQPVNDRTEHVRLRFAAYAVLSFVLLLWGIKAFELASDVDLSEFGVLPRTLKGTIGIFTGPLIHGDVLHLISNTIPILFLGTMLFYFYRRISVEIFIWIYLLSGFWTWLMARSAYHIGASGIVYGMASFLFFSGIIRRNRRLMTLSGIIIFLYGSMVYGIFPEAGNEGISWESHLAGAVAGAALSFFFRNKKTGFKEIDHTETESKEEENDPEFFRYGNSTDEIEINYVYKPKEKKP